MRRFVGLIALAAVASLGIAPSAHASVVVPPEVAAAGSTFATDPQAAATTWAAWAATSPMTYTRSTKRPKTRSSCSIDAARIAYCNDFAQVIGRGNRNMGMKKISEIITAGDRQYFRDPPLKRWTRTRTASDPNPISGIDARIGYNPWLPWVDQAADISTRVLDNGSWEILATNPSPAEGKAASTVARVSANGLQASVIEFDERGRQSAITRIVIKPVPAIRIPKAR